MDGTKLPAQAEVVVIGAGLAGLSCALHLTRAGVGATVLEAGDAVGGRVRTDLVDGFRCDRGFQLLNPAYPDVPLVVDVEALALRPFAAGVAVARGGRRYVLADPRREPSRLLSTVFAPVGPWREKVAFGRWALGAGMRDPDETLAQPDLPYGEALTRAGVDGMLRRGVVDPFLAGVLGEGDGATSHRLVRLLVRSFVRGTPCVPADGMQAFPERVAAGLPAGTVHCGVRVSALTPAGPGGAGADRAGPWTATTSAGPVRARVVVVATDPPTAGRLTSLPMRPMHALTTYWHAAPPLPDAGRWVHVDADRRGPVVNSAVLSNVSPAYAPAGRALVASTVLGASTDTATEQQVRQHLAAIHRVDTRTWDLVTTSVVRHALPATPPPFEADLDPVLGGGLFVAGDHRDTASIQGALLSGRRAAHAVLAHLAVHRPWPDDAGGGHGGHDPDSGDSASLGPP